MNTWGAATIRAGTPTLSPDTVKGGKAIRFAPGSSLAVPAGKLDFLSREGGTILLVWRSRIFNPGGLPFVLLDSSSNGATPGFQLRARDNWSGPFDVRRLQVRVSDGAQWVVNQRGDQDQGTNHFSPLQWNAAVIQLSPARVALWTNGTICFDDVISAAFPQAAPGPFVIGGSHVDIGAVRVKRHGLSDEVALAQAALLAARYNVDLPVQVAGTPTNSPRFYGFPAVERLPNGRILATIYDSGLGGLSADTFEWTTTTGDQGLTWTPLVLIPSLPGHSNTGAMPRTLSDGSVALGMTIQQVPTGTQSQGQYWSRSDDNGATWATPFHVTHGGLSFEIGATRPLEHGGAVYWSVYSRVHDADVAWNQYLWKSTDGFATSTQILVADGSAPGGPYRWAEGSCIPIADETCIGLVRRDDTDSMYEVAAQSMDGPWSTPAYVIAAFSSGESLTQLASGRIIWVGRSRLQLSPAIYQRTGPGAWNDVPQAIGLDGSTYSFTYAGVQEVAPGKLLIVYGRAQDFVGNAGDVVAITIDEWMLDGHMPMTALPASATFDAGASQQIDASGAGPFAYAYAPGGNVTGGSLSAAGVWVGGPAPGTDTIHVTDVNGQVKACAFTVAASKTGATVTKATA